MTIDEIIEQKDKINLAEGEVFNNLANNARDKLNDRQDLGDILNITGNILLLGSTLYLAAKTALYFCGVTDEIDFQRPLNEMSGFDYAFLVAAPTGIIAKLGQLTNYIFYEIPLDGDSEAADMDLVKYNLSTENW